METKPFSGAPIVRVGTYSGLAWQVTEDGDRFDVWVEGEFCGNVASMHAAARLATDVAAERAGDVEAEDPLANAWRFVEACASDKDVPVHVEHALTEILRVLGDHERRLAGGAK